MAQSFQVWFEGINTPSTPQLLVGQDHNLSYAFADPSEVWITASRFATVADNDPGEVAGSLIGLLTVLADRIIAADKDVPAELALMTTERKASADEILRANPGSPAILDTSMGRQLAYKWQFADTLAFVALVSDNWIAALQPARAVARLALR